METITLDHIDKSQPIQISPAHIQEILASHGIENGEVINTELRGDKVILFVIVHNDNQFATIEEVNGILLARAGIIGTPQSVRDAEGEEQLNRSITW